MTLASHHYAMLHTASAIDDAVIAARGYQSLTHPDDLRDLGFSKAQSRTAPALAIPLWDVHGQQTRWQIRPDSPRQMADGKVNKYELPTGARLMLDVHPSVHPRIADPHEPLWITEGVRKGDALASQGVCVLALVGGVWGFKGTNEHKGKVILPDWEHVALNGRQVHVVFDSDLHTNPKVQGALQRFYAFLRSAGAVPSLVQWPEAYRADKWGVDDFFAAHHTMDELRGMLPGQGPLPTRPPTAGGPPITFDRTERGTVRPALLNILYVLEQDPAWQGRLGYNLLLNDIVLRQRPPYLAEAVPWMPRPVTEQDWAETANWLQRTYHLYVSSPIVGEGLTTYGFRFPFHPIRDYLRGLVWDGTPRLELFLHTYCHVADTAYSRGVSRHTLRAAVARILDPGCKVDTLTILEGEQGLGKSMTWRILAGDDWFTDGLPDLHDKDAAQTLCGKWFIELAELSQFHRSEIETVKSFLSRQADHYRPSYGRRAATFPRQQIFVGTTNADHYFKDRTGNRRYWPVTVEAPCDLAGLRRDRDQLWAEAVAQYEAGARWYMDAELEQLAREEQAQRLELDDWEDRVIAHAETFRHFNHDRTLSYITTLEVLTDCLHLENALLHTVTNTRRVGSILRGHGWKPYPVREEAGGRQFKAFVKAVAPPTTPPPPLVTDVTDVEGDNIGIGNAVFPNNHVGVTDVTDVTDDIDTQGTERRENAKNDISRFYTSSRDSMENIGNIGNEPPIGNGARVPLPMSDCHPSASTPAPAWQCYHCHGTAHWRNAGGEPICVRCHPQPSQRKDA
jgi:putative DNA primase/helicase